MQPDQQQRIMGYFIEEAKDHLNTIEQGLLNLQSTIEDPEMINEVFRAAHSVKGGAAMLGLNGIQRVSHRLEDFFKVLKDSSPRVDQKLENLFLKAFDALQELLGQLQGPFGLTEDAANQIIAGVEPTFNELEQHLNQLAGVASNVPAFPVTSGLDSDTLVIGGLEEALEQLFRQDVPLRLREMLQLFKQPEDDPVARQQLQELCRSLASLGEQYQLHTWCHLVETARRAIAHPDNRYRILAPIIIRDIKLGQELVLAGRTDEIAPCIQLQELVPIAIAQPETIIQDDLADLLASDITSADALGDDQSLDLSFADLGASTDSLDLGSEFETGLTEDLDIHQGPEVGMAELNSLADLFEGEMPDLGLTWQQEEVLMDGTEASATNVDLGDLDDGADFSDLLFEEEVTNAAESSTSDDFSDLFGGDLEDDTPTQAAIADSNSSTAATDDGLDEFADLLEISDAASAETATDLNVDPDLEFDLESTAFNSTGFDEAFGLDLDTNLLDDSASAPDFKADVAAEGPEFDNVLGDLGNLFDGLNEGDLHSTTPTNEASLPNLDNNWSDQHLEFETPSDQASASASSLEFNLDDLSAISPIDSPEAGSALFDDLNLDELTTESTSEPELFTPDEPLANSIPDPWSEETNSDQGTNEALTDRFDADPFADLNISTPTTSDASLADLDLPDLDAELGFGSTDLNLSFEDTASDNAANDVQAADSEAFDDLFGDSALEFESESPSVEESGLDLDDLLGTTIQEDTNSFGDALVFEDADAESITTSSALEETSLDNTSSLADLLADDAILGFDDADLADENLLNGSTQESDRSEPELSFDADDWLTSELASEAVEPSPVDTEQLADFGDLLGESSGDLFDDELSIEADLLSPDEPAIAADSATGDDAATLTNFDALLTDDTSDLWDDDASLGDVARESSNMGELPSDATPDASLDGLSGMDDLFGETSDTAAIADFPIMDDLLGEPSTEASADFSSMDDLLAAPSTETGTDFSGMDDLLAESSDANDLAEMDNLFGEMSDTSAADSLDMNGLLGESTTEASADFSDMDDLLGESPTEASADFSNMDNLLGESSDDNDLAEMDNLFGEMSDTSAADSLDMNGLLGESPTEASADFSDMDDLLGESPTEVSADFLGMDDLLGESSTETSADFSDMHNLLGESSDAAIADFSDMDDLLAEPEAIPDSGSLGDLETANGLDDLNALLEEPTPANHLGQGDEFGDLEELLDNDSSNTFADLDGLLDDGVPSMGSGMMGIQSPVDQFSSSTSASDLEDFSDLESLLAGDSLDEETPETPISTFNDSEFDDLNNLLKDAEDKMGGSPTIKVGTGLSQARRTTRPGRVFSEQTMRVPVKHLDNLSNLVGELVVNRNSLEQDQERLRQSLDNLLYQVQQLSDVGQRMQDLYERSLLESSLLASRQGYRNSPLMGRSSDTTVVELDSAHPTGIEYDPLEMDRFTGFHSLSQEMIELIVRVRESSSDIEFIVDETEQVTRMFRQVTTQLQEGLTRSRMVPFAQTADRLPRAVRDISMKVGKQAELVVEGRETLIDKMILEQLYDPMTHLVNNAITHGIESPSVRAAAGKPPAGRITIRAFHQGNQTIISVSDDGAGIDVERVKSKAVEKGLITSAEAKSLSRLDVYDILFHPGFSTKDQADDFSGRGVGMDVVRTSLSEIRGVINTDSNPGKGTTFTIRLPLTLSISKALCCISDRARIAFPMDGVEDMLDVPKERIQTNSDGQPCIAWRDTILPVRPLPELLGYNRHLSRGNVYGGNQEDDMISIVVLRSAGNFLALQVDQVMGEQEIVIKQLEGPVPKPVGVAGATVLGDGRIMPIADVLELIDLSMGRIRRDAGGSLWEQGGVTPTPDTTAVKTEPMVLIVDDSITVRELLSMTFNKVGYRVEQARDGQEAWEKLRSGLPCDIVFCDIEMPRMDGLELLSRIQKDINLKQLPIAMLTSRGADRHRQMAASLGASGYFTKPYLEEALLDAAQRMLKGERLLTS